MDKDIPSNLNNPSDPNGAADSKKNDPMPPTSSPEEELDPKTKDGFQRLVSKKDTELQAKENLLRERENELSRLREEAKKKKLAELDEADRLRVERDELAEQNAKLIMSNFAQKELQRREIKPTDPLYEIVVEAPWAIPVIKRSLGDSPTWAEVIQVVQDKLPSYLDSLVSNKGETRNNEPEDTVVTPKVVKPVGDPERQPTTPSKRVWSRKEIADMSDADYLKHRTDIIKASAEGRVV